MKPGSDRIFAALEAGWPAAAVTEIGPFRLRRGLGGGQRVSAATVHGAFTETDFSRALAAIEASGEAPVFQIQPSTAASLALDRLLAARGWLLHDPVSLYLGPVAPLSELPLPRASAFAIWPPLAIQRDIWAANGIGPARLAVMDRAETPRTALLARSEDRSVGVGYVAVSDRIAGVHAVAVDAAHRRKGAARMMMLRAARWASENGADWLALAVTRHNEPAKALYASLGMVEVEQYHYRIPRKETA